MPRDTYNDGELVTDDLGRLWLVSALKVGQGLLMPELPDFLTIQEEKKASVEGFEFDQMADGIAAENAACRKLAATYSKWGMDGCQTGCGAPDEIAKAICLRSRQ